MNALAIFISMIVILVVTYLCIKHEVRLVDRNKYIIQNKLENWRITVNVLEGVLVMLCSAITIIYYINMIRVILNS